MNNELTVLLVEDNPVECQSLIDCIYNSEKLVLAASTDSAYQALNYVQEYYPNIIILDLELHMGSGTGLDVLKNLNNLHLEITPYILVTTNNISSITHEFVHQFGADFIITKNQADYSAKTVVNFILMLYDVIQNKCHSKANLTAITDIESPHLKKQHLKQRIHLFLNNIGINPKVLGYNYLTDAIELSVNSQTEHLSNTLAQTYRKSPASIERAMQNAINKAWSTCDINTLEENYTAKIHPDRGVPTITEFICYYAIKIRDSENFLF